MIRQMMRLESWTIGEETAVEVLKRGATDYTLKDRLSRLPTAVSRALEENKERKRLAMIEEKRERAEAAWKKRVEPIPLSADPVRLEQIIVNVASNAVKYSERGGAVHIAPSATRETAQSLR